jgi:hypothetical protein
MEDISQYGQENFSMPHDVVQLPSRGIFYKNKKSSVKVGYLTAADENILMGRSDDVTMQLLRNKLYEPGMRPEELLEGDIEAILIFLRNTSFGPEMEMTLKDPVTGNDFKTQVLLDELNINKGIEPDSDGTFSTTLPVSGAQVKLRPLTYGDGLELRKVFESYPQGRVVPRVTMRLVKEIQSVNGNTDKGEISKFVEQMPIADSKFIKKFMNENEPRLDMERIVMTPSGERLTVNVGFGVEFFRPFF